MYVYRDVTSGASQCITVTRTVTPDSTAMLSEADLWQEPNGKEWDINSTMLGCWGWGRSPVQIRACACVRHHQLYITGIPLACVLKSYVWVILLIPQHWIISWQFLLHGVFFFFFSFCCTGWGKAAGSQEARGSVCKFDIYFKEKTIDFQSQLAG